MTTVVSNPIDLISTGLVSLCSIVGTNSIVSGEFVNSMTGNAPSPSATRIESPFIEFDFEQVVYLQKIVDEEEESWLKLAARSRKKLVAEDEL
jgi:hypothetical protein